MRSASARLKVVVMAATVALASSSSQAVVVYRDVAALTAEATRIVVGDVVEVTSFWNRDRTLIKSRIVVGVDDYLVGQGGATEVLEMIGGTVGDMTLRVSVLPVFEVGDHVLLFLGNGEIGLVQSFQGAYLTDGQQIARMAPACQRVIEESIQPLNKFLQEIQEALPPGVILAKLTPYEGDFVLPEGGGERYVLCGADWTYMANPMGEVYRINANCADGSCGSAASQRTQIQNGSDAWDNAGADFAFTFGGTTTQTNVAFNGTNIVYFDTTPPAGGGYLAATFFWTSGSNITECDMVFNDQFTWWNGSGGCPSNTYDIWAVAAHEFGHYLCLDHSFSGTTMYFSIGACQTGPRTLHSDDINGIIAIYGSGDNSAPTPNPMTWATPPFPLTETSNRMTATTASDGGSPPVNYFFDFVSGGSGGSDSLWQGSTTYDDLSLQANTAYSYRVKARDNATPPNETAYSSNATTATHIQTPTGVSFGTVTSSSIVLNATGTLSNLTVGSSGVFFDSTTAGGDGGINVWIQTASDTATGLGPDTTYFFRVKARNQNSVQTSYSSSDSMVTLANVPGAPGLSNVAASTIDVNVNPNGNPSNTEFAIRIESSDPTWDLKYVDASGAPSGTEVWQTDADWGTTTLQGLDPDTQYTARVKARNGDLIETSLGAASTTTTLAVTPPAPTLSGETDTTIDLDVDPGSNPSNTEFAIRIESSDPTWDLKYVDASGSPSGTEVWQTDAAWGTITLQGLERNTQYTARVKARNGDLVETPLGPPGTATTLECANPPCGTGACCDTITGICTNFVVPGDCLPPFDWYDDTLCADVDCVPRPQVYMAPAAPTICQNSDITIEVLLDASQVPFIDLGAFDIGLEVTPVGVTTGSLTPTAYEIIIADPDFVFFGLNPLYGAFLDQLQGGALNISGTQVDVTTSDAYLIELTLHSSSDADGQWKISYKQNAAQVRLSSADKSYTIDVINEPNAFSDATVTVTNASCPKPHVYMSAAALTVCPDAEVTIQVLLDGSDVPFEDLGGYDIGLEVTPVGVTTGSLTPTAYELNIADPDFVFFGLDVLYGAFLNTLQGGALNISGTQVDITTSDAYLIEITLQASGDADGQWNISYKQNPAQVRLASADKSYWLDVITHPDAFFDATVTVADSACNAPSVGAVASRFIAISPAADAQPVAFLVTNECTAEIGWVRLRDNMVDDGPNGFVSVGEATAGNACDDAEFRTPTEWAGPIYVTGDMISPEALFTVVAVTGDCANQTLSPTAPTASCTFIYCDTDGDGILGFATDLTDIFENISAGGWLGPLPGYRLDVQGNYPAVPDGLLGFSTDLEAMFNAIGGTTWSNPTCPGDCP